MLMDFYWHDWLAVGITAAVVFGFIILLVYDAYDDYRHGRDTSTWKKPKKEVRHG